MVGHARRVLVAEELHIAAERDGRDLPARATAVVEAGDFGTEAERESQHPDAAQAGHQEMAKLMKKHDNCQDEEERHDIADEATAERAQARHDVRTHYTLVPPDRRR